MKNVTNLGILDKNSKNKLLCELKEFYIPYRKTLELPKNSTFGCEIEFKIRNYSLDNCPSYVTEYDYLNNFLESINYNYSWNAVPELDDHIEIISPILKDENSNWKELEEILEFLISKGAYYSGGCGAHVHVGKQVLGTDINSLKILLKLWMIYEDVIIKFTNGINYFERKNFRIASDRAAFSIKWFLKKLEEEKITEFRPSLHNKLLTINFCTDDIYNFLQEAQKKEVEDTIEFRCANGTLNKVIWQNLVNFYVKLMDSCSKPDFDLELLTYRESKGIDIKYYDDMAFELCDLVFDNNFDKYCFLRQYYKDFDESNTKNPLLESKPFWK